MLEVHYPHLPSIDEIKLDHLHAPASARLYSRLNSKDIDQLTSLYPIDRIFLLGLPVEREIALVNYAVSVSEAFAEAIGLPQALPPPEIHRMQRGDEYWRGDIYSANMVLSSLETVGHAICRDSAILDIGCSSGSLLRVLKAVFPNSVCTGFDPVLSSINWAKTNLPGISFHVSSLSPPLNVNSSSVNVITAISIWSHYSPSAARAWLDEMHRVLLPDGVMVMTIHGIYSLLWHCRQRNLEAERVSHAYTLMCGCGYYFEHQKIEQDLPVSPDWGNMYMTIEWLYSQISFKWEILLHKPGRNQYNQDVVVLKALKGTSEN